MKKKKLFPLTFLLLSSVLICFQGCADDSGHEEEHEEEHESPGEHACEHVEDLTLAIERNARAEANGDTADVSEEHRAYQVTLTEQDGQYLGFVDLEVDVEGDEDHAEIFIFRSPNVVLEITDGDGNTVELEDSNEADQCDELDIANAAELETGSYILKFGPTNEQEVLLVIEHAEHDDHDEE